MPKRDILLIEHLSGDMQNLFDVLNKETDLSAILSHKTREIPRAQRERRPQALSWYFDRRERDPAIAEFTGLSVSRINRLIGASEAKRG
jgi:hypothetical protein